MPPDTVQLVNSLGHDFNNLLGIVLGGVSLLRDDLSPDALGGDARGVLEDMLSATREASMLIERLTASAGCHGSDARLIDLNEVVRRVAHERRAGLPPDVALHVAEAGEAVVAWMDPDKLRRCLHELLDNAVTATAGDGVLQLRCGAQPVPHVEVIDNGPGMSTLR